MEGGGLPRLAARPGLTTVALMSKPLGPYSPIVRAGDFLIVSGQGGMLDGRRVEGGVAAETRQALANLSALLESEGASLRDVVKTTCFLVEIEAWAHVGD